MARISRVRLAAFGALALACLFGCRRTTEDGNTAALPTYIWRGNLVDSATGAGVGGLVASVRERPEHVLNGWNPYVTTGIAADGRFEVIYYLRGVYPCSAFPDITLGLHLDFADPAAHYAPTTHESDRFIVCPRVLPPRDQWPINQEEGLRIVLVRQ